VAISGYFLTIMGRTEGSVIFIAQLPVNPRHGTRADEPVVDAAMDRLAERSHHFELAADPRRQRAISEDPRSAGRSKGVILATP